MNRIEYEKLKQELEENNNLLKNLKQKIQELGESL